MAVLSGPEQAAPGAVRSDEGPCEVTIVAHDIGPVGGMERVLSELILGLRERGEQVTVIARTCELPAGSGVRFHRVRGPGRPFLLAYPWFLLAASLVVARRARGVLQVTGGIVLNRADVVSVHYCHQVGPANPSRSSVLYRVNIRLVRIVKRLSERAAFHRNREAVFACVSEGVAEEVREHYPRLAPRVIAIHNGVDLARFEPGHWRERAREQREQLGIGEHQLVALFVGGEWQRKGLAPVVEALADAPEWMLAVVGPGDRARFEQLARSLGVHERIRWLGVQREVAPLYAMADAFVLPTSYETFSLATFEAAASGLALLATPVNGVRELLEPGVNGFFIDRRPQTVAGALGELSADRPRMLEMGRAARRASLRFSWENTVERHHELYRRLSGGRRGAPAS
jgi:UDP-glucose:(heptosyl)LPS alpha-1,3-glucosyltransferase